MSIEINIPSYLRFNESENSNESITKLCTTIRDFSFEHVNYEHRCSYEELISDFVVRKKGACSVKHYLLGEILNSYNLEVRYISTPFFWKDILVEYPTFLKKIADQIPRQIHLSLEIGLNGITTPIDVTWDKKLERAGFPINYIEHDIHNGTLGVVSAGERIIHNSGLDRFLFIESIKNEMKPTGIEKIFYEEFSKWLNLIRQN